MFDESVLEDTFPMYGGYYYIIDGRVKECDHFNGEDNRGISVADYKRRYGVNEIKRCDLISRIEEQEKRRSEEQENFRRNFHTQIVDVTAPKPWYNNKKRRPRSSNKIKKVKLI